MIQIGDREWAVLDENPSFSVLEAVESLPEQKCCTDAFSNWLAGVPLEESKGTCPRCVAMRAWAAGRAHEQRFQSSVKRRRAARVNSARGISSASVHSGLGTARAVVRAAVLAGATLGAREIRSFLLAHAGTLELGGERGKCRVRVSTHDDHIIVEYEDGATVDDINPEQLSGAVDNEKRSLARRHLP